MGNSHNGIGLQIALHATRSPIMLGNHVQEVLGGEFVARVAALEEGVGEGPLGLVEAENLLLDGVF